MPTRHGWAAVAAAIGTVVSGRLFGVLELYVVGAALLAAAVVAVVLVNRPLPALRVRRLARPATVATGEPARVDLQLLNDGRTRTPPELEHYTQDATVEDMRALLDHLNIDKAVIAGQDDVLGMEIAQAGHQRVRARKALIKLGELTGDGAGGVGDRDHGRHRRG